MKHNHKVAEVSPPGEFVRREIEAHSWTQDQFARIIGHPLQTVNEIISGEKCVTAPLAKAIGLALGTGADFWLDLENYYQLWSCPDADPAIARRAAAEKGVPNGPRG